MKGGAFSKKSLVHLRIVNAAIEIARNIPRAVAIRRVERDNIKTSRRPLFVVSWDPRLQTVSSMTQCHCPENKYIGESDGDIHGRISVH